MTIIMPHGMLSVSRKLDEDKYLVCGHEAVLNELLKWGPEVEVYSYDGLRQKPIELIATGFAIAGALTDALSTMPISVKHTLEGTLG